MKSKRRKGSWNSRTLRSITVLLDLLEPKQIKQLAKRAAHAAHPWKLDGVTTREELLNLCHTALFNYECKEDYAEMLDDYEQKIGDLQNQNKLLMDLNSKLTHQLSNQSQSVPS